MSPDAPFTWDHAGFSAELRPDWRKVVEKAAERATGVVVFAALASFVGSFGLTWGVSLLALGIPGLAWVGLLTRRAGAPRHLRLSRGALVVRGPEGERPVALDGLRVLVEVRDQEGLRVPWLHLEPVGADRISLEGFGWEPDDLEAVAELLLGCAAAFDARSDGVPPEAIRALLQRATG